MKWKRFQTKSYKLLDASSILSNAMNEEITIKNMTDYSRWKKEICFQVSEFLLRNIIASADSDLHLSSMSYWAFRLLITIKSKSKSLTAKRNFHKNFYARIQEARIVVPNKFKVHLNLVRGTHIKLSRFQKKIKLIAFVKKNGSPKIIIVSYRGQAI